MKKNSLNKKLSLNKTTISDLSNVEMKIVRGGMTWTDPRVCNTDYECSIYYTELYTCNIDCPYCNYVEVTETAGRCCPIEA